MYNKTDNMNELVLLMQDTDEGISLQDIMKKYYVSLRTATRMKDAIVKKYPQIKEIQGRYNTKKWKLPKNSLNNFINFTVDEIHALESAARLLNMKSIVDGRHIDNVICKIKSQIGHEAVTKIEPDTEALIEAEGYAMRPGPKINKVFIEKLRTAVIACKIVLLTYNSKSGKKEYFVDPYGFLYGNKHYLLAFDHSKKKICHFDMNKILDVELDATYFIRNPEFSLQEFVEQSFGVYQEEPFDVEWLFDAEVADSAAQYIFHPTQKMKKNKDGTLTVKFRAGGAREMDWHLYTWGGHVKVIKLEDFDKRK